MQRTIESLTAAGRDALSRDDFVDARARHLTDQHVPLINGYFVGGGGMAGAERVYKYCGSSMRRPAKQPRRRVPRETCL